MYGAYAWVVVLLFFAIFIPLIVVVFNHTGDKNAVKKISHPANSDVEKRPDDPDYVYSVMFGKETRTMTAYKIKQSLQYNIVKRDTLAWRPGAMNWHPLYEFPELEIPPPTPGCEMNEFPITMLALFCIPYCVLKYFFNAEIPWWGWAIYNSAFACWDSAILNKNGYSDKKLWALGLTIMPLYIICRACYTKRYRWIFLYFLSFVVIVGYELYTAFHAALGEMK